MKKITALNQVTRAFVTSLSIYVSLFFLFDSMPSFFTKKGVLQAVLTAPAWVNLKAKKSSALMEESNLALNFIGNIHKLSFEEAKAFQASGLTHLLAISGGQIVPLANFFSSILAYLIYYLYRKKRNPTQIMRSISYSKNYLSLFLSFYICYIFGCSGALLRTSVFSYLSKINFIRIQHTFIYAIKPHITSSTSMRLLILVFVTFSFGNVFQNYSFLLSAIGASCAEISGIISHFIFKKSLLFHSLGITVLTSVLVGVILSPFMSANILDSCMANILSLPIVGFLITPFSLLALFIPSSFFLFPYIVRALDFSFWVFKKIAFSFYSPYNSINPFSRNNPMFTNGGAIYLSCVLIFLWIFIDIYRERRIFLTRTLFTKL